MFGGREKILIGGLVVFAAVFVLFVFGYKPSAKLVPLSENPKQETEGQNFIGSIPRNAFLPNQPTYGVGQFNAGVLNNTEENKEASPPQFSVSFPSMDQLQNAISSSLPSTPQIAEKPSNNGVILALPNVPDGELNIGADGLSSADEYLVYFAENSDKINFDTKKLTSVLKDEYGIFLTAPQLVEKELKDGASMDIQNSLLVQKEFMAAELSFLRQIKVFGDAAALNKKMIGANLLTTSLIDSGIGLINGTTQKDRLIKTYDDYTSLISEENGKLLGTLQIFSFEKRLGIFNKLAKFLGIIKSVFAVTLVAQSPFGGFVVKPPVPCVDGGYSVVIGPPLPPVGGAPPGNIHVSPASQISALLFPIAKITPGTPMIGLYAKTTVVCSPVSVFLGDISAPPLTLGGAGFL